MYKKLILLGAITKIIGILITNNASNTFTRLADDNWKQQFDAILTVNPDELLIAEVALNYRLGKGYVSANEIKREGYVYNASALRPTYPVWFHIVCQNVYHEIFPDARIIINSSHLYFKLYALILYIVSFVLFIFSIPCFYSISQKILVNKKFSCYSVCAYTLYPSVFYYIGNLPNYESIALSCIIIGFHFLYESLYVRLNALQIFTSSILISFSTLIRPQLNIILFFILAAFFMVIMRRRKNMFQFFQHLTIICILIIIPNIFVLTKNKEAVGRYALSTQSGYSFFEGHNPFARGSWCGDCGINPDQPFYQFVRKEIKNFDSLNEVQRGESLKKLGLSWIFEHPLSEIWLSVRKCIIFFLPYNSDSNTFNVINLLVHLGTISFLTRLITNLFKTQKISDNEILLTGPLIGSVVLCIIFFVGYRWRYYAEPFMILAAMYAIQKLLDSRTKPNES